MNNCDTSPQFRPIGTRLTVQSTLTGAPLTYFCPHPLRVLVADTLATNEHEAGLPEIDLGLGMLLVRYLLRQGLLPKTIGSPYSGFEPFLRPKVPRTHADFIALASALFGRPQRFREAISFSGGPSPSSASHIYPPHQEVARLFEELPLFFCEDWQRYAAIDVVVLVFYYALSIHPFANGNGRWARQLAIAAAAKANHVWLAAVLLTLFANSESQFIDAWRRAQDQGLSGYLKLCRAACRGLVKHAGDAPEVSSLTELYAGLSARCGQQDAGKLFGALLVDGMLDAERIAMLIRCSKKKALGVLDFFDNRNDAVILSESGCLLSRKTVETALARFENFNLEQS
ncbi:MAG: Fic family protein [Lysobacter sp.]|nr:Fic family protein [Lysobacter sp.]